MQGAGWIALFERIPPNYQDSLALGLTTGAEVMVQRLIKLENDYMVLRGRMAGSTDAGRVVIVPYTQLVSIAFTRRTSPQDVQAIFGESEFAGTASGAAPTTDEATAEAAAEPEASAPEIAPEPTPAAAAATAAPPNGAKPISKSILLARLRERLAEKSKS